MSDARQQLNEMRNLRQRMEDIAGDAITEAATRKDFRMVADLISKIEDPELRRSSAEDHAKMFALQNPRFRRDLFMAAAGVSELEEGEGDLWKKDELYTDDEFDQMDSEGQEFVDKFQSQLTDNDPCMYCDGEDPACEVCSDPGNMYEEGDYRDEPNRPGWKDIHGHWTQYEDCPTCHGWGDYLPPDVEQDMDNIVPCPTCGPETEFGPAARAKTKDIKDYADSMDMDYTDLPLVKEEDDGYRECDSCRGAGCQACHDHGYVEDEEQLDESTLFELGLIGGFLGFVIAKGWPKVQWYLEKKQVKDVLGNFEQTASPEVIQKYKDDFEAKLKSTSPQSRNALMSRIKGVENILDSLADFAANKDRIGDEEDYMPIKVRILMRNLDHKMRDVEKFVKKSNTGVDRRKSKKGRAVEDISLGSIVESVLEDFPGQPKDYEMSNDELAADIEDSTSEFERDTIDPEIEDEELGLRFD